MNSNAVQEYQLLPVKDLALDTSNPRIRKWIEIYGDKPTPEQIYLALGAGSSDPESSSTTFNSLRESIRTNGGIVNPIVVNRRPGGQLVVIEGNTRVAIYRTFKDDKVAGNWDRIPALVYENLSQIGIDAIRLQAHLVGPRPWDPYSKAKYLHQLRNQENIPFNQLVDLCGGKKREVQDYISAYADMEKHYRHVIADDGAFDATRFSAFVELQKPAVKESILTSQHTLDDFARWVDQRLIDPLNTVRLLPRILANEKTRNVFLQDGAKEAAKLLETASTASTENLSVEALARALMQRINQLPWREVERLKNSPDDNLAEALFEVEETLVEMCNRIRDR